MIGYLQGKVLRRSPEQVLLDVGGVGYAVNLWADIVGHWEKRNGRAIRELDPARLDPGEMRALFEQYADDGTRAALDRLEPWRIVPHHSKHFLITRMVHSCIL